MSIFRPLLCSILLAASAATISHAALLPTTDPAAVDSAASQPEVTWLATIVTTKGEIEVELYGKDAPKTVANFVGLAKKKFYNGILFHRVVPGFVIQAGDPYSKDENKRELWGTGGESIYGGPFADELNPASPSGRRGYGEGTLAMANSGPNTNSSQFFIVLNKTGASHLPFAYTIFGAVRKGMDVVHAIEKAAAGSEMPANPIAITSVKVKEIGKSGTATKATSRKRKN